MILIAILTTLLSLQAKASFMMSYGLNYSSQEDSTSASGHSFGRTFNKIFLGGSINSNKNLFFGWNVNSWSSELKPKTGNKTEHSILEMGPKLVWFSSDEYKWYLSLEWNPYTKGDRATGGTKREVLSGNSYGFGFGYRYRISQMFGIGAGIHYHTFSPGEEKVGVLIEKPTVNVTNLMPMLELTFITR
jgi:hypothetical protein